MGIGEAEQCVYIRVCNFQPLCKIPYRFDARIGNSVGRLHTCCIRLYKHFCIGSQQQPGASLCIGTIHRIPVCRRPSGKMRLIHATPSTAILGAQHIPIPKGDPGQYLCPILCKAIRIDAGVAISEDVYIGAEQQRHAWIQLIAPLQHQSEHFLQSLRIGVNARVRVHINGIVQLRHKVKPVVGIRIRCFILII